MAELFVIGIDIGGTNTSYGIVNKEGRILAKGKMFTQGHDSLEAYIQFLAIEIGKLTEKANIDKIHAVGVGAPNANYYSGEIVFAPNLPWKGVIPMASLLSTALKHNVTITNDANAAALGEMIYGAAKGMKDFIQITLGTGLGSGFIANGQIIYGHDGLAGELGHITAVRNGRKCACERYGCLERYCSATGIVITAEEWLKERNDESLLRQYEGNITAEHIYEAAINGDKMALEIYDYTGMILGQALADAVAITSPQAIFFFGGLAKSGELILKPTKKYMEENLLRIYQNKVALIRSALPDSDAAILGASALAW